LFLTYSVPFRCATKTGNEVHYLLLCSRYAWGIELKGAFFEYCSFWGLVVSILKKLFKCKCVLWVVCMYWTGTIWYNWYIFGKKKEHLAIFCYICALFVFLSEWVDFSCRVMSQNPNTWLFQEDCPEILHFKLL